MKMQVILQSDTAGYKLQKMFLTGCNKLNLKNPCNIEELKLCFCFSFGDRGSIINRALTSPEGPRHAGPACSGSVEV